MLAQSPLTQCAYTVNAENNDNKKIHVLICNKSRRKRATLYGAVQTSFGNFVNVNILFKGVGRCNIVFLARTS